MLELKGLVSGYDKVPVLHNVDLFVGAKAFTGILGRNGMGKTTLLRAIMGELPGWQGQVLLNGIDISRYEAHQRAVAGIGFVPQGRQIFPTLTVEENLRMGCVKNFAKAAPMVERMLELFPRLKRLVAQPGGSLSGGEQQLLALAAACAVNRSWCCWMSQRKGSSRISVRRSSRRYACCAMKWIFLLSWLSRTSSSFMRCPTVFM